MENQIDFDKDVIARSEKVPVLVDFWSPTCGPCLMLGPILERLADDAEGKWELVKINTMHNQQVAVDQGIQSIPHVKLFSKGKVVSEFVGALPESTLRKWLDEFLPTPEKEELNEIRSRLNGEGMAQALKDLEAFVEAHPGIPMGRLLLASHIVMEAPQKAEGLVEDIKPGHLLNDAADNVRILAELLQFDPGQENGAAGKLAASRDALKAQDYETAVRNIVEAVEIDKEYSNELPRRGAIALFRMFGPQHPLTVKYRRKFEMALY